MVMLSMSFGKFLFKGVIMLTAQQTRHMIVARNYSTRELNEIEDLILLAIQRKDDGIQVQLPEQQVGNHKVCPTVTKDSLDQLKDLGYNVEGPVKLVVNIYFEYEDGFKNIMCYRISW